VFIRAIRGLYLTDNVVLVVLVVFLFLDHGSLGLSRMIDFENNRNNSVQLYFGISENLQKCFFIPQFSRFAELTYLCCYPLSLLSFYPSVSIRAIRGLYLTDNVVSVVLVVFNPSVFIRAIRGLFLI